jgi:hypothetical protein
MALIFGAIAPASAPAGTVAVIHEYRAKGPLTNALYAVVGPILTKIALTKAGETTVS